MAEKFIKNENEAIETIKSNMPTSGYYMLREALDMAISALEEIQKYREIGTVEECRAAVEKLPIAEDAIKKLLCSEYGSSCQFCIHNNDRDAMCRKVGGSGSWCCENAKWNGRLELRKNETDRC